MNVPKTAASIVLIVAQGDILTKAIFDRRHPAAEKLKYERDALERAQILTIGNACSEALIIKGEPGRAERAGSGLLSGTDGKALKASLTALGYAPEDWCGLLTVDQDGLPLSPELLRRIVATLDPTTLVLCDEAAAQAVREAYADQLWTIEDLDEAMLVPGTLTKILGVRVLSLGNFADALDDAHQKQVMWARLKQIPPLGAPY
jgi:hypothetical protein